MTHEEVLERDIKNVTGAQDVSVTFFPDDELTVAVIDGLAYVSIPGSDDGEFGFKRPGFATIVVPFSDDWLALQS
jgi:hypothetical protein